MNAQLLWHTYMHHLVLCKVHVLDPTLDLDAEPSSPEETTLSGIEQRIVAMDARFEQLEGRLAGLEEKMAEQSARFVEVLNALAAVGGGLGTGKSVNGAPPGSTESAP